MYWQIWPWCFKIYRPAKFSLALACWPWSFISPDNLSTYQSGAISETKSPAPFFGSIDPVIAKWKEFLIPYWNISPRSIFLEDCSPIPLIMRGNIMLLKNRFFLDNNAGLLESASRETRFNVFLVGFLLLLSLLTNERVLLGESLSSLPLDFLRVLLSPLSLRSFGCSLFLALRKPMVYIRTAKLTDRFARHKMSYWSQTGESSRLIHTNNSL